MVGDDAEMAYSYLTADRDQQFLLPPDVREWLPAGHLVWTVLDVVALMDTAGLHAAHPNAGVGRAAYDPEVLLAVLVYAYCSGVRSSRRIEQLCKVDVAFRVLCANRVPDHTTIARFRQTSARLAKQLFCDVLEVCANAGLVSVGLVAVDGTKLEADAAKRANRTRAHIEAEVQKMFEAAEAADAADDDRLGAARGDELPDGFDDPRTRGARLAAALAELDAQAERRRQATIAARAARQALIDEAAARGERPTGRIPIGADGIAEAEARLADSLAADADRRAAWQARGRRGGRPPGESRKTQRARKALGKAVEQAAHAASAEQARVNVTDPDSRVMKTSGGYVQGYNAQAAVNTSGIIVAADVTQDATDYAQCVPMMQAVQANLDAVGVTEPIGIMVFDAGYCSTDNLTAPGPDRLIATAKTYKLRQAARDHGWAEGDPPHDADPVRVMEHRLRTQTGAAIYSMRQYTVEPVFGHIKHGRRIRRFARRGIDAVQAEWQLICATQNILKLHRVGAAPT